MRVKLEYQVDAIEAHLHVLPAPGDIEDIVNERRAELKSKVNIGTVKTFIVEPINVLIKHVKNVHSA